MENFISQNYEPLARMIKALSHPTRLFIVEELSRNRRCVCELREKIGADMSTVSKHLSLLKDAGIVEDEKEGTKVIYGLRAPCILPFVKCMERVIVEHAEEQLEILKKR